MTSERPIRIHHVVSGIHRQDAGPSYSVTRLAETLHEQGSDVHLHALEPAPDRLPKVPTTFYPSSRFLPTLGISEPMRKGLKKAARTADIMHFHGMWMMPNVYPGWAVSGTDCKLVMSPRGMMEPWAMQWSSARKLVFRIALQQRVLKRVDKFMATGDGEAESIRRFELTSPISVVPIGIDLPASASPKRTSPRDRTLLYLGRLHEKKNLDGLIRAWDAVGDRHLDWNLTIAGDGAPSYIGQLKSLAGTLGASRIRFVGSLYGTQKDEAFQTASVLVLPTFSENFGIVVAEALANSLPVITTTGTPWSGLQRRGCGWYVEPDDASLAEALSDAMSQSQERLETMGRSGRAWAEAEFSWASVGRETLVSYQAILSRSEP